MITSAVFIYTSYRKLTSEGKAASFLANKQASYDKNGLSLSADALPICSADGIASSFAKERLK